MVTLLEDNIPIISGKGNTVFTEFFQSLLLDLFKREHHRLVERHVRLGHRDTVQRNFTTSKYPCKVLKIKKTPLVITGLLIAFASVFDLFFYDPCAQPIDISGVYSLRQKVLISCQCIAGTLSSAPMASTSASFGSAPTDIFGFPSLGTNSIEGILRMPKSPASSCSSSTFTL